MNLLAMIRLLLPVTLLLASCSSALAVIDFDREVRPVLADHCYACHGPDEQSRQGGDPDAGGLRFDTRNGAMSDLGGYRAIVPGQPEKSEFIRRILSTDDDERMPPADHHKQLSDQQKHTLVEWVRQGATWSDQWAWKSPQRFTPPAVRQTDLVSNWIDRSFSLDWKRKGLNRLTKLIVAR